MFLKVYSGRLNAARVIRYLVCVSVCPLPLFMPPRATMRTTIKTYHWIQREMRKVLNLVFSFKMLHSGIFAYSTKVAIFLALLSMYILTRGHVILRAERDFDSYRWYIGLLHSISELIGAN